MSRPEVARGEACTAAGKEPERPGPAAAQGALHGVGRLARAPLELLRRRPGRDRAFAAALRAAPAGPRPALSREVEPLQDDSERGALGVSVTRHDAASGEPRVFKEDVRGVDHGAFGTVLAETVSALGDASIPYLLIGGIASSGFGRPRWTHDIDVLVRPEDAERTLEVLGARSFDTERTDSRWIYKAFKQDVMVDVIFRPAGGFHLDAEMLGRAVRTVFLDHVIPCIPPEDLLVMKAVVHDEGGPRHWHDALAILATTELDWEYLLRRAARGPRRVLSLLIYAHSLDLLVPNRVIKALHQRIYES